MTVLINKSNSNKISKILLAKFSKQSKKGNLAKHFNKLKRGIDGLDYQSNIRINED